MMVRKMSKRVFLAFAAFAMTLGLSAFVAPPANAASINCRVFTATSDFYEAGVIASKIYYVPGAATSECKDINVRNVKNLNAAGDYCATFKVQFFPTSGGSYYNSPKTVCSQDPDGSGPQNGLVVPIATNVLNGTKYRVLYNVENLGWSHSYQIVD
jgi:hypothetical protein